MKTPKNPSSDSDFVLNLNQKNSDQLNESWLAMFGGVIKTVLSALLENKKLDIQVKGTETQVNSFVKTVAREKEYILSAKEHGLNDPKTAENKAKLLTTISHFEEETGIKYPFR
jgi:hypothetical protein